MFPTLLDIDLHVATPIVWALPIMAEKEEKPSTLRRYVFMRWDESGFPKRVNHAVTSFVDEHGQGFMYSLGGFKGKGIINDGYEQWPDLGRVPMDVVELNLGMMQFPPPACMGSLV